MTLVANHSALNARIIDLMSMSPIIFTTYYNLILVILSQMSSQPTPMVLIMLIMPYWIYAVIVLRLGMLSSPV